MSDKVFNKIGKTHIQLTALSGLKVFVPKNCMVQEEMSSTKIMWMGHEVSVKEEYDMVKLKIEKK
ncbi:MAG: hypothetical protein KAS62_09335 [Candidatus Delongbacteria bacterium]|nr:hypothetical protein [Candidatus Delongbacteria bacterium]